jgi:hypothetical protein
MHQRRRIVLLFGAGIVLPSLLLGYLAFRGIQNDRALLEKERLEETRKAAEGVLKAVDEKMTAVEIALSKIVADRPVLPSAETAAALERLAAASPLVEQVFSLRDLRDVHFPVATLLYVPDGRRPAGPIESARIPIAQELEFRDNDYPRALAAYRQALERTNDPRFVGTILNAIARVQRKSGLLRDAVLTY